MLSDYTKSASGRINVVHWKGLQNELKILLLHLSPPSPAYAKSLGLYTTNHLVSGKLILIFS